MSSTTERERALARRALADALHPGSPDVSHLLSGGPERLAHALPEARWSGVTALLAHRLDAAGRLPEISRAVRTELRQAMLDAQTVARTVAASAGALLKTLERSGVRNIVLKGAALAHTVYEHPWLRPMCDVDVLIDPARFEESLHRLETAGFRLPPKETIAFTRDVSKCVPVGASDGAGVELELHWAIVQEHRQTVNTTRLFEQARPFELDGHQALILGPVDLLLHQTVHHAYHVFEPKLIWLVDLALLHLHAPPPGHILEEAERWGMRIPLALSVLHLEKVFPGCVQPALIDAARAHRRAGVLARLGSDADPLTLLRGWKSAKTQLFWKLVTLDSPRQMAAQLAAWTSRARRHGARPGQVVTIE